MARCDGTNLRNASPPPNWQGRCTIAICLPACVSIRISA